MRCEQVRKGVQYVQENQDWQEKEGKQSLCITSFYVWVFPLPSCTSKTTNNTEGTIKLVSNSGYDWVSLLLSCFSSLSSRSGLCRQTLTNNPAKANFIFTSALLLHYLLAFLSLQKYHVTNPWGLKFPRWHLSFTQLTFSKNPLST